MKTYNIYSDGSFIAGRARWAFLVEKDGEIIHQAGGALDGKVNESYQIGGECQAAIEAIKWTKSQNGRAKVHYDYIGLENWIADIWGRKPWKANKPWTQEYRKFMLDNKQYIHSFIKVKAHSGQTFNELVDNIAKNS